MTTLPGQEASPPNSPKKASARGRVIGLTVAALVVLGGAGIVGYYAYNGRHYVSTDNARVAANTVNVTPEIPGRVLEWNVAVGSQVEAGQVIGQIDTSTVAQSSAANAGALSQTAPLTASRSVIRAPISGQVIQSSALVGQLVGTGQALAVIADNSGAYISANVKEEDIGKVQPGQAVRVTLDSAPGQALQGRVQRIGQATASTFSLLPSGGADTGNFTKVSQVIPVSIYLTDPPANVLRPGSSANVRIDLRSAASTVPVTVVKSEAAPLNAQIGVVGTLTSQGDVTLTPQVAGSVASVGPQVGDRVTRGQVLVRLDDSTYRAQLTQAQAALSQAQNAQATAQANLQLAASTLDRLRAVYALGGVSRQDLQNAQTQYTAAQVAARNASGGALEAAQAAVRNLQLTLDKTVIKSPIDGVVSARNVEPGEAVAPGQPLLSIVQNNPRTIVATIPASQAGVVRTGQEMRVTFDALPGRTFTAHVSAINPASVATGDFFPVEARLDASGPELRAGLTATGELTVTQPANLPLVPATAIAHIGAQSYVYEVQGGKARQVAVQTGLTGKDPGGRAVVTVTSGLGAGTPVVADGVQALWDGAPVQVQ